MKAAFGTGRRKTSVAQAKLLQGTGKIIVNKLMFEDYFPVDVYRMNVLQPINATNSQGKFDINITVRGGGKNGQTGAIQLAIARALFAYDNEMHKTLREAGLLTRDPRMVERKKYGQKKARKRFQFSKR